MASSGLSSWYHPFFLLVHPPCTVSLMTPVQLLRVHQWDLGPRWGPTSRATRWISQRLWTVFDGSTMHLWHSQIFCSLPPLYESWHSSHVVASAASLAYVSLLLPPTGLIHCIFVGYYKLYSMTSMRITVQHLARGLPSQLGNKASQPSSPVLCPVAQSLV